MPLLTFPLWRLCIRSEKMDNLLEQVRHISGVGIDIGHHLVVFIQIQDDSVAVRTGQEPDSAAESAENNGHQDYAENDPPSFFHAAGTSL